MTPKYAAYLRSPAWAEVRRAVAGRSGGTCERCGLQDAQAVHHTTYDVLYFEMKCDNLRFLQHLCDDCHQFVHRRSDFDPTRYKNWIDLFQEKVRRF